MSCVPSSRRCSPQVGLQLAMLLIPGCHLLAGLGLAATEGVISAERESGALPAEPKRA